MPRPCREDLVCEIVGLRCAARTVDVENNLVMGIVEFCAPIRKELVRSNGFAAAASADGGMVEIMDRISQEVGWWLDREGLLGRRPLRRKAGRLTIRPYSAGYQ